MLSPLITRHGLNRGRVTLEEKTKQSAPRSLTFLELTEAQSRVVHSKLPMSLDPQRHFEMWFLSQVNVIVTVICNLF